MDTSRYNVLLVVDDLVQIDLARRAAVESCPEINLTTLDSGDAVLEWLGASVQKKELMPHIILMDLKLPKLDGLAVLRKLRGFAATGEIPIVVFSGEYTQADLLMSYKAGANSFVAKPVDLAGYAAFFCEHLTHWMHPQQRKFIFPAIDGAREHI